MKYFLLLLIALLVSPTIAGPKMGKRSITGKWGELTVSVAGKPDQIFKDLMIGTHMEHEWNWSVSGTKHDPGVALPDVKILTSKFTKIVSGQPRYMVIGNGYDSKLKITSDSLAYLQDLKASGMINDYFFLPTADAIDKFNQLSSVQNNVVVALIHSTC